MIYKKQNALHTEYKLSIDTTDTHITYEYFLKKPWAADENKWTDIPVYSRTCTYDEFKVDHHSHQKPQDAHILYGFFDRYRKDTNEHYRDFPRTDALNEEVTIKGKVPVVLDVIKHTKDSKAGVGDVTQLHGGFPVFIVAIPFKDSPVQDWVFITEAEETYFNDILVTDSLDIEYIIKQLSIKHLCRLFIDGSINFIIKYFTFHHIIFIINYVIYIFSLAVFLP